MKILCISDDDTSILTCESDLEVAVLYNNWKKITLIDLSQCNLNDDGDDMLLDKFKFIGEFS